MDKTCFIEIDNLGDDDCPKKYFYVNTSDAKVKVFDNFNEAHDWINANNYTIVPAPYTFPK